MGGMVASDVLVCSEKSGIIIPSAAPNDLIVTAHIPLGTTFMAVFSKKGTMPHMRAVMIARGNQCINTSTYLE